jgi:hypothetical protein
MEENAQQVMDGKEQALLDTLDPTDELVLQVNKEKDDDLGLGDDFSSSNE